MLSGQAVPVCVTPWQQGSRAEARGGGGGGRDFLTCVLSPAADTVRCNLVSLSRFSVYCYTHTHTHLLLSLFLFYVSLFFLFSLT